MHQPDPVNALQLEFSLRSSLVTARSKVRRQRPPIWQQLRFLVMPLALAEISSYPYRSFFMDYQIQEAAGVSASYPLSFVRRMIQMAFEWVSQFVISSHSNVMHWRFV